MTKRVALVDIDGCLVQNGKLNMALVKKLQEYDEIILFTQRSKYIQTMQASIWRADPINPKDILITPDAVEQLSKALSKPVKVSTSVDRFFGSPLKYYDRQLKDFEIQLKDRLIEHGEMLSLDGFERQYRESEVPIIRKLAHAAAGADPSTFYPRGKVEQYVSLTGQLPAILDTREEITVDFFDDHPENLQEIMDHEHLPIEPTCYVVGGKHMCTLEDYNHKRPQGELNTQRCVMHIEEHNKIEAAIDKLKAHKKLLAEQPAGRTDKLMSFFHVHASVNQQISAIDKAIQILSGADVDLSERDLRILKQQPIKKILGDLMLKVDEYNAPDAVSPVRS
jgi:hypothetical protein